MNIQARDVRRGIYYFEHEADAEDGVTVRLVAWLGEPLRCCTIGYVGRDERADLISVGVDPITVLIDALMA